MTALCVLFFFLGCIAGVTGHSWWLRRKHKADRLTQDQYQAEQHAKNEAEYWDSNG